MNKPDIPTTALRPRHGQVIIAPWEDPTKGPQLLELPDKVARDVVFGQRGMVIAVGPGRVAPHSGKRMEMDLKPGDVVWMIRSGTMHDGSMEIEDITCGQKVDGKWQTYALLAVDEASILCTIDADAMEKFAKEHPRPKLAE